MVDLGVHVDRRALVEPPYGADHSGVPVDKPLRSDQVTAATAARLPRQNLRQTQSDLVEAAVRIVNEYLSDGPRPGDPPVDPLPMIRLDEVLDGATALARERLVRKGGLQPNERVAPLTPGAFYKAFADDFRDTSRGAALAVFRRVVLRLMVENALVTTADTYITFGRKMASEGQPWSEVVRLGVNAEFTRWQQTPALLLMNALALHSRDREVGRWACQVDRKQLAEVNRIYEELLPVFNRRIRPGLSIPVMAMAVSDLIAGMVTGSRFDEMARDETVIFDAGDGAREWHPCSLAAWTIYNGFTEPIPTSDAYSTEVGEAEASARQS